MVAFVVWKRRFRRILYLPRSFALIAVIVYINLKLSSYYDLTCQEEGLPEINGVRHGHTHGADKDITIVTAYFDLGTFQKGKFETYSTKKYLKWTKAFKFLNNRLVVYTDSEKLVSLMKEHRKGLENKTEIVFIDRNKIWTFQIISHIKAIFSQKGYPKHAPNTIIPEYACAQHSKYTLVPDAIRHKYFNTSYYAWLDIGYFRDLIYTYRRFSIIVPEDFQTETIGFNLVNTSITFDLTYQTIIYDNIEWVGGGFVLGKAEVFLQFEKQYKNAVMFLLHKKLMSTDQHVLLSMYSLQGKRDLKPEVQLQLYFQKHDEIMTINENKWFYFGYKCLIFTTPACYEKTFMPSTLF